MNYPMNISTTEDARRALMEIARLDGIELLAPFDIGNGLRCLAGMELALRYPEWALALVSLANDNHRSLDFQDAGAEIVARFPISMATLIESEKESNPNVQP